MSKKIIDGGKVRQLKGTTITAKVSKPKGKPVTKDGISVVQGKEVPTKRIDSARRANPQLNRALGKAGKNSGGMDEYREGKADLINSALKKKK